MELVTRITKQDVKERQKCGTNALWSVLYVELITSRGPTVLFETILGVNQCFRKALLTSSAE